MSQRKLIETRARLLREARNFFYERGILEVDVPALSPYASIDAHIDLIPALYEGRLPCYLHSSPEYGMKRLLAQGSGDIYQLSHVFRDGDLGYRHHPEFMMAEWYRIHGSFDALIEETLDFIRLFLGPLNAQRSTYRALLLKESGIDPLKTSCQELKAYFEKEGLLTYAGIESDGVDGYLNLLLSTRIESLLGQDELFVLTHYPASQAALAKTLPDGTAERFEVYYKGVELANGYHELIDPLEQERRLLSSNQERQRMGKSPLPIDHSFLEALKKGLPPSSGVAVGVDRLIMLNLNSLNIVNALLDPAF